MPHKRTKSKRQTLKTKYTVEKKVKEHNRKLRKDLRANPHGARKLERDPGIPNLAPFKLELEAKLMRSAKLVKQSHAHQQRRAAEIARRRMQTDEERMHEMRMAAAARADIHAVTSAEKAARAVSKAAAATLADTTARAAAETSRRAFFKHMHMVVSKADIILEVLDARDPLACRAPEVESLIVNAEGSKKLVLVLNKIDLVPPPVVMAWLRYLRQSFPAIAFKASTQQQRSNLAAAGGARVNSAVRSGEVITGSGAAGADVLMQLIKNYSRSHDKKKAVTVGVIGYPNVGKSSIINSLKRNRAVGVSSVPGFTKTAQEVQLDAKVRLLDCPGIIFDDSAGSGGLDDGGAGLLLRNCVSVESMADPELAVSGILRRCEPAKLMSLYELPRFDTADQFLALVARKRGKLVRGGEPDINAAAKAVLQDWNSGAIPFFTVPPAVRDDHERAAIVTEWAKELDLDSLERAEAVSVFGGPTAAAAAASSSAAMALTAGAMPTSAGSARMLATSLDGDDDDDDDEAGAAAASSSSASSSSSAAAAPSAAVAAAGMGWDASKLEDRERRRAAAAARPVRKPIDEEEAAVTMLAGKGGAVSAKKLRKDRRRAMRAADEAFGGALPAPAAAASSSASSGAADGAKPAASAGARPAYSFDEFF